MDIELRGTPLCCQKSLEQIRDVIEVIDCLEEFLALAPTITKPMLPASIPGILWRVVNRAVDWKKSRKETSKTLQPIVQSRIRDIIDWELLRHSNDSNRSKQWTRLKEQLLR